MKRNIGLLDKMIRIALAVLVGFLFFAGTISGAFFIAVCVLSAYFLFTSLISFCPAYVLFGIRTKQNLNERASKELYN